jgi:hypothetical protein
MDEYPVYSFLYAFIIPGNLPGVTIIYCVCRFFNNSFREGRIFRSIPDLTNLFLIFQKQHLCNN